MLIIANFIVAVALSVAVGGDSPAVGSLSPHLNDDCELTLRASHVPGRLDPYGPSVANRSDPMRKAHRTRADRLLGPDHDLTNQPRARSRMLVCAFHQG